MRKTMKKTVCELFAGVGGFRLGLNRAADDWDFVWADQWEPSRKLQHAFNCYCKNFGDTENHINIDISQIDKKTIPDHNLLVGGFPCQDYSVARTLSGNTGIQGKKGVLWWEIREVLKEKRPAFVLLENVDRLLKSPSTQRGRDFGIMLASFKEFGYNVEWRVINAAEYGGTQRRRRTFIFAYNETTNYAKEMEEFSPLERINEKGFFANGFHIERVEKLNETEVEGDLVDVSESFKFEFKNSGCLIGNKVYTSEVTPIYEEPIPLRELLEKDVDEKYYLGDKLEKWEYLKGAKKIERVSKTGHKYIFSEGPVGFPDDIDKPARTMLTSESSVNRSTHVVRDPQTGRLRLITPVEAERINGFDDNWTKTEKMPEKFRYFCMGNALVVPMVTRMGKILNKIFDNEK